MKILRALGWLPGKLGGVWELLRSSGKSEDEFFTSQIKPDFKCIFPGCWNDTVFIHFYDKRRKSVAIKYVRKPGDKEIPFFSNGNWLGVWRQIRKFLKNPVLYVKRDIKFQKWRERINSGRIICTCRDHSPDKCPSTESMIRNWLKENGFPEETVIDSW